MEFGWSQIFAPAETAGNLNSLRKNTKELEMLGSGIHALQGAYAHYGSYMDESRRGIARQIYNDMTNESDMAKAQKITTSAITVFKLMTNDFSKLSKKHVLNITTTGMNRFQ